MSELLSNAIFPANGPLDGTKDEQTDEGETLSSLDGVNVRT